MVRIVLLCVGEALVVFGLWAGIQHEVGEINRAVSEISDLKDPSPFRVALMGHLGKIHLGLEGYLRSGDPSLAGQVAESRKDFEALLPEFMKQNPKLFPPAAGEEIKRTFGLFKEAIDRTLEANTQRLERRGVLEQNFTKILYHIDHNLFPIIRKEQADGEERGEAALNIENQMRAWQQNLSQAWAQPSDAAKALTFENDSRGETYLELYGRLELLSRERKIQREIKALWQANSDLARETFVKESIVTQAEKAMDGERDQVVASLNKHLPALPPAQMETRKSSILNAMHLHMAGAGGLTLLGVLSLLGSVLAVYRLVQKPAAIPDGLYRTADTKEQRKPEESTLQMDLKGVITAWNSSAEALYGYSSAEMCGESISKLFESETEIARLGQELQKAKRATFETTHKAKGGAAVPVRIEFQPVLDGAGHATAIGLLCTRR
jgi:PAS domain S-box-containing protein